LTHETSVTSQGGVSLHIGAQVKPFVVEVVYAALAKYPGRVPVYIMNGSGLRQQVPEQYSITVSPDSVACLEEILGRENVHIAQ
jgi:hypothetical protein